MPPNPTPNTWMELHTRRINRGWTLADLARESGVSHPYVSQLESGQRDRPRPPILAALAKALGCTIADLASRPAA